jgi:biopolymer transport protein TolR
MSSSTSPRRGGKGGKHRRHVAYKSDHGIQPAQANSDINVTPLVDVCLVLLIIFMVVTPMIASGVAVDLPKTTHHAQKPDDGKDIIISLTQDKELYVGAQRVARNEDLARLVEDERRRTPEKALFLKADARASFGSVKRVMQLLHEASIDEIVVGTEELPKSAGK